MIFICSKTFGRTITSPIKAAIDGNALQTSSGLDFELNEFVSIRVRSTDLSGLSVEEVFEFDLIPNPELELDIPTTFSPNGDNINPRSSIHPFQNSRNMTLWETGYNVMVI